MKGNILDNEEEVRDSLSKRNTLSYIKQCASREQIAELYFQLDIKFRTAWVPESSLKIFEC